MPSQMPRSRNDSASTRQMWSAPAPKPVDTQERRREIILQKLQGKSVIHRSHNPYKSGTVVNVFFNNNRYFGGCDLLIKSASGFSRSPLVEFEVSR